MLDERTIKNRGRNVYVLNETELIGSDGRVCLSVEHAHTSRRREGTGQETGQQADG